MDTRRRSWEEKETWGREIGVVVQGRDVVNRLEIIDAKCGRRGFWGGRGTRAGFPGEGGQPLWGDSKEEGGSTTTLTGLMHLKSG